MRIVTSMSIRCDVLVLSPNDGSRFAMVRNEEGRAGTKGAMVLKLRRLIVEDYCWSAKSTGIRKISGKGNTDVDSTNLYYCGSY